MFRRLSRLPPRHLLSFLLVPGRRGGWMRASEGALLPRRGSSIISSRLSLLAAVLPPLLTGCSKENFSNFTPRSTDLGSSISLTFLFGSLVALRDILLLIDNQQPVLCSLSLCSPLSESVKVTNAPPAPSPVRRLRLCTKSAPSQINLCLVIVFVRGGGGNREREVRRGGKIN